MSPPVSYRIAFLGSSIYRHPRFKMCVQSVGFWFLKCNCIKYTDHPVVLGCSCQNPELIEWFELNSPYCLISRKTNILCFKSGILNVPPTPQFSRHTACGTHSNRKFAAVPSVNSICDWEWHLWGELESTLPEESGSLKKAK